MLTKTKIALATALIGLTGSVALAHDADPNRAGAPGVMRTAPAKLLQSRNVGLTNGQTAAQASGFEIDRSDRASSPYAGGY